MAGESRGWPQFRELVEGLRCDRLRMGVGQQHLHWINLCFGS